MNEPELLDPQNPESELVPEDDAVIGRMFRISLGVILLIVAAGVIWWMRSGDDDETEEIKEKELSFYREEFIASARSGRPTLFAEAMVDPSIGIVALEIDGVEQYFSELQYDDMRNRGEQPRFLKTVLAEGKLLNVGGNDLFAIVDEILVAEGEELRLPPDRQRWLSLYYRWSNGDWAGQGPPELPGGYAYTVDACRTADDAIWAPSCSSSCETVRALCSSLSTPTGRPATCSKRRPG